MKMDSLIESIEEALSDQDKNKLDYLRKREKAGKLKPDQKGELRRLDRVAKAEQNKATSAAWLGVPHKSGGGSGSGAKAWGVAEGPKHKQLAAHYAARDAGKPSKPKPKSFLGKLGKKLHSFITGR